MASNNLEASLLRALQEPVRRRHERQLEAVMVTDAALRRLAGRLTAILHDPDAAQGLGADAWTSWKAWITETLNELAAFEHPAKPRPEASAARTLERIARQLEMIDAALPRAEWTARCHVSRPQ
ncbi:hypothetical protein [Roseomonas chloroacetimidivorans]|uniref:hypothetical protein n=1 Tax=Roseomonas chloroacetimidivorans TaxID=1766656 RepID=UPI003C74DFBB